MDGPRDEMFRLTQTRMQQWCTQAKHTNKLAQVATADKGSK